MEFTFSNVLPAGVYEVEFLKVEEFEGGDYGDAIRWVFVVTKGKFKDDEVTRITTPKPTLKNACGRILKGIVESQGETCDPGKGHDARDYYGRTMQVVVEDTASGYSRVASVLPIQEGADEGGKKDNIPF